jgi:putative ABC transport system substrate-binding protein
MPCPEPGGSLVLSLGAGVKRRDFISFLGGAAASWPLSARAQQSERMRRIGVLLPDSENEPQLQERLATFKQRLQELGWTDGRNVRLDYRFTGENTERISTGAGELVAVAPDVIFVYTNPAVAALRQATRTIPVVFAQVADPVGTGIVASLTRPGGNITGFHSFETAIGGKWLEILKQIAPGLRRAAVVYLPDYASNVSFLRAAESASTSFGITVTGTGVRNAADIERDLTAFAREPNGGLIVAPNPATMATGGKLIIALAARLGLPAIYPYRFFPTNGGLVSYGSDLNEQWRGAASYIDRILRGANPAELPVQLPTKYQLVINNKTAKALGLKISESFLLRADEVIE